VITGNTKNKVDQIWEVFWSSAGITNPLTVIEQFTYLLFIKGLDDKQMVAEKKAMRINSKIENPLYRTHEQHLRWSQFKNLDGREMLIVVNESFEHMKTIGHDESEFTKYLSNAVFTISQPMALERIVTGIDSLLLEMPTQNEDTMGDLYEYLLSKLSTSGTNGQFRTPRHIIELMVALMQPSPQDQIIDPATGTAGFLVAATEYIRKHHGQEVFMDLTKEDLRVHFNRTMVSGFDTDATMLRIAAMNLILHGIENPRVIHLDSLSKNNTEEEAYTLVLANPPFTGSLDQTSVAPDLLKTVKTPKTEILFLALILRLLKKGGRGAVIVPDGVLFGATKAHRDIRMELIENHKLEAVISMPSGVFRPYAGVSTGILIFTKTGAGGTDNVWFYNMTGDGFSLDDKRKALPENHLNNNIPEIISRYKDLESEKQRARTEQSFFVSKEEIIAQGYDLSINRYKEFELNEIKHDDPNVILTEIRKLDSETQQALENLEEMLR